MKRVLIITYYWPPSGGAGVQRWLKFSKYLPEFHWEPVILTVDPEYATYPVTDASLNREVDPAIRIYRTKSKELFSLYKKVSGSGQVPHAGFAGESKRTSIKQKIARFVRGNFFLPDPRKGWNRYALDAASKLLSNEDFDCIVTTGPPHSTHLIGLKLTQRFPVPWLADFRDPWTDIYYYKQFFPTFLADRYNRSKERKVLEQASMVLTVGPSLKEILSSKIQSNQQKVMVITNGFDPEDFKRLDTPEKNHFTITYVGTIADAYPLEPFFNAMSDLLVEFHQMRIRFIGTVAPKYLEMIATLPRDQVELMPYVEHSAAINYMSSSDVLLLVIPEHSSSRGILTGKLFEYLAVARPILLIGPKDGDAAKVIMETGSGEICSDNNVDAIKNIVTEWLKNPPSTEPVDTYSRVKLTGKLAGIIDKMLSRESL